jgi:hypothetical protein
MPKSYGLVTERLLKLPLGKSCVVEVRKLDLKAARRHAPDRQWTSESVEGGLVVTRVR